jgi:hypothetical protein
VVITLVFVVVVVVDDDDVFNRGKNQTEMIKKKCDDL